MPNPDTWSKGKGGCMVHAGILKPYDPGSAAQLTSGYPEAAKEKFIKDVIDELMGQSIGFPCGDPIPPVDPQLAAILSRDLPDRNKFPDFHKNYVDYYAELAQKMDSEGGFSLLSTSLSQGTVILRA